MPPTGVKPAPTRKTSVNSERTLVAPGGFAHRLLRRYEPPKWNSLRIPGPIDTMVGELSGDPEEPHRSHAPGGQKLWATELPARTTMSRRQGPQLAASTLPDRLKPPLPQSSLPTVSPPLSE